MRGVELLACSSECSSVVRGVVNCLPARLRLIRPLVVVSAAPTPRVSVCDERPQPGTYPLLRRRGVSARALDRKI